MAINGKSGTPTPLYGFYLPRKRVAFNNELVNPVTGEITHPPSMTKQEFKKQCDINNIIKEFTLTGQISHMNAAAAQGAYLDLPDVVDYQEHLHTIMRAEDAFASLPAQIRDRFKGDPAAFLAFVQDPANADELVKLGIREPPPPAPAPAAAPASGGAGGTPPAPTPAAPSGEAPGGS